jgi:hypothetical protein
MFLPVRNQLSGGFLHKKNEKKLCFGSLLVSMQIWIRIQHFRKCRSRVGSGCKSGCEVGSSDFDLFLEIQLCFLCFWFALENLKLVYKKALFKIFNGFKFLSYLTFYPREKIVPHLEKPIRDPVPHSSGSKMNLTKNYSKN